MNHGKILGIDFGTSRTVFSMTSTEAKFEPEIVEVDGAPFVETVLRLDDAGDIERFGTEAWEQIDEAPERTYYEFKMGIGRSAQQARDSAQADGAAPPLRSARELGIAFLRRAREKIERQHFNSAALASSDILTIIGYPAEWNEKQREETLAIAREAGFPNVRGCSEPVGAIYYHHYKGELSVDTDQMMLVYDFGGGTSDVAVVRTRADEKPRIMGVGGASDLGGRNFDDVLYARFVAQCGLDAKNMRPKDVVALRRASRALKEKLAAALLDGRSSVESTVTLHGLRAQKRLQLNVSDFNAACAPLMERFPEPVWDALNRADVSPEAIQVSILAGGSARMHYVRRDMDTLLPNDTVLQSLNPGEVVAKGLAVYGRALLGEKILAQAAVSQPGSGSQASWKEPKSGTASSERAGSKGANQGDASKAKFWSKLSKRGKVVAVGLLGLLVLPVFLLTGGKDSETPATNPSQAVSVAQPKPVEDSIPASSVKSMTVEEIKRLPVQELQKRAMAGGVEAQFWLGRMYDEGRGVPQSDKNAAEWYLKAAEQGHDMAQNNLGARYYDGRGVHQSYSESLRWFHKAANQGNVLSQFWLGWLHEQGFGVHQSDSQAVDWYSKAADQGDPEAQFRLGLMNDQGRGIRQSNTKAAKWYHKAAEQGNVDAQFWLGRMYDEGRGVPQSDKNAAEWYLKAAEQGHDMAQNNLGARYYDGRGVHQSYSESLRWFHKAANQGNVLSQFWLGWLHEQGFGVHQSDSQAVDWYSRAAEQGEPEAQFRLGVMYENGRGVAKNLLEAYRWYYISSRLGFQDAVDRMKRLLENKWVFFGANVTDADARRIEREAEDLIRSKGWLQW